MTRTIFEKSQKGQHAYSLPSDSHFFEAIKPPKALLRQEEIKLPEVSEIDLTRHFNALAARNMSIDDQFYPLGSCTMKLNPRVNEWCAALAGFKGAHPLLPEEFVQGNLQVIEELTAHLIEVCGMTAGSLLPCAGAHGEFVGVKMIAAYHALKGDHKRTEMLVPDSAHGTNPASAAMLGLTTVAIRTDSTGDLDLEDLKAHLSERTAGLMLTNPSTLGLFSPNILKICKMVHDAGGLLYYDGANLNAILEVAKPGAMGFDVMHLNLHKTYSTPHGGGGPGSGPVLCNDRLKEFLPTPQVVMEKGAYKLVWQKPHSIGKITGFHGNFGIYLRALLYAKLHGHKGLRRIAEIAVLNANYLKKKLSSLFKIPFKEHCMHEFVVQADSFLDKGVKAQAIAKRLLDYGFHAPTVYFPLTVKECLLIEPTESESKATLDEFVAALESIVREIEQDPDLVKEAPHKTSVGRVDEVRAAKELRTRF